MTSNNDFYQSKELAGLLDIDGVRQFGYTFIKSNPSDYSVFKLARAIAENPDEESLLLLLDIESKQVEKWVNSRTLQKVITVSVPIEDATGNYRVVPSLATELRKNY